jgi:DNA mismatch endonuclease (patch repair protein)
MAARLGAAPKASTENARNSMRGNRRRDTGPELVLRAAVRVAGLRGYRLDLETAPGRPDIAFTRYKLAVFVHGCFWHRCPHCDLHHPKANPAFWKRKFELNAERDERKRRQLEAGGWEVLEMWECEVKRSAAECARRVKRALEAIQHNLAADEEVAELRGLRKAPIPRRKLGRP